MSKNLRKRCIALLERLYAWLFRLYPGEFRREFSPEMTDVFAAAIGEAAENGWLSLAAILLRELRDLPPALVREYGSRFRQESAGMSEINDNDGAVTVIDNQRAFQSNWPATVLGTLPILTLGATEILNEIAWGAGRPRYWNLAWIILLLLGLAAGWIRRFPRWSFAYPGLALLFGWWWGDMTTPGWRILGHTFQHGEHWGWRAWAPLIVLVVVALLWTRSLSPLRRLVKSVWHDWTLASFALYNVMAWLFIAAAYDENHHPQLVAFVLGSTVVLSGGALFYLRSAKQWQRILSLLVGFYLSVVFEATANHAYWSTRMELGWGSSIWGQVSIATVYAAVMCTPALLTLLRGRQKPLRPA